MASITSADRMTPYLCSCSTMALFLSPYVLHKQNQYQNAVLVVCSSTISGHGPPMLKRFVLITAAISLFNAVAPAFNCQIMAL
jgi:hypothetical protein